MQIFCTILRRTISNIYRDKPILLIASTLSKGATLPVIPKISVLGQLSSISVRHASPSVELASGLFLPDIYWFYGTVLGPNTVRRDTCTFQSYDWAWATAWAGLPFLDVARPPSRDPRPPRSEA
eukprot:1180962-Prorocentrum_minimum.AAC.3